MTDPAYQWRSAGAYADYLLEHCAYLAADSVTTPAAVGLADEHAGMRSEDDACSILIAGYHVEGAGAFNTHAFSQIRAGLVSLEEGIYTAVCIEIAGAQSPCSAVAVLALIEVADETGAPSVLIVRRAFARISHLELKGGLLGSSYPESDTARVSARWQRLREICSEKLEALLRRVARRWGAQSAYLQIQGLSAAPLSSNVSLEGALVAFQSLPARQEPDALGGALDSLEYHWNRFAQSTPAGMGSLAEEYQRAWAQESRVQLLRQCGLTRGQAAALLNSSTTHLTQLLDQWLRLSCGGSMFEPEGIRLDASLWSEAPTLSLSALAQYLRTHVPRSVQGAAALRSLRQAHRFSFCRAAVAARLYGRPSAPSDATAVGDLIRSLIAEHRCDGYYDYEHHRWCGVVCASDFTLSLYQSLTDDLSFGFVEWALPGRLTDMRPSQRVPGGSVEVHALEEGVITLGSERDSRRFAAKFALK
jgi:hypothetical protein